MNYKQAYTYSITATSGAAASYETDTFVPMALFQCGWLQATLDAGASTGTGTNPTLDIIIETTIDGTNWKTLLTFTQLGNGAANVEHLEANRQHATAALHFLGERCRVKFAPAADSGSEAYTGTITIAAGG